MPQILPVVRLTGGRTGGAEPYFTKPLILEKVLKLEDAGLLLLSVFLFSLTEYSWWIYPLLILAPDIGIAGYLVGTETGAITYNLFHHLGLAVLLYIAGSIMLLPWLQLWGIIQLGHASLDRVFGFGLKYTDSFYHTHLGLIGRNNKN